MSKKTQSPPLRVSASFSSKKQKSKTKKAVYTGLAGAGIYKAGSIIADPAKTVAMVNRIKALKVTSSLIKSGVPFAIATVGAMWAWGNTRDAFKTIKPLKMPVRKKKGPALG